MWNGKVYFKDQSNATDAEWQDLSDYAATVCDNVGMDHTNALRTIARTEFGPTTPGGK